MHVTLIITLIITSNWGHCIVIIIVQVAIVATVVMVAVVVATVVGCPIIIVVMAAVVFPFVVVPVGVPGSEVGSSIFVEYCHGGCCWCLVRPMVGGVLLVWLGAAYGRRRLLA